MRPLNVLFLCTGNSARSIMAESYLNHAGRGQFRAYSAGSFPKGEVNPLALATLRAHGVPVGEPRSKSWDEFATPSAAKMDLVITVCDNAAGEVCPFWPGTPAKAHWSFPDPHDLASFESVFAQIRAAIDQLTTLPIAALDPDALRRRVADIGPR
jgi:arsenate reductase (thioredoxin)